MIILAGSVLGAARQAPIRVELTEVHMGLPVRVVLYAPDEARAREAAAAAFDRIGALDAALSDYRPDSELNRLSATHGEWVPVSRDLFAILSRAVALARATDGSFDPTVGPLVRLWRQVRETGRLPDALALATARARVGWQHLSLDVGRQTVRLERAGMRLDLGGIAKGYVLQEAFAVLEARGVSHALLEAGGDVVAGDPPPGRPGWSVDVPGAPAPFAASAAVLARAALATSGPTFQFVEIDGVRYSHVLDPASGLGVTHDAIAHVIAPDGATADALATALSVTGPSRAGAVERAFAGVRTAFVPGRHVRLVSASRYWYCRPGPRPGGPACGESTTASGRGAGGAAVRGRARSLSARDAR